MVSCISRTRDFWFKISAKRCGLYTSFYGISKSKFLVNRRSSLQCFSRLKHRTKWFCTDFSWSDTNRMQLIANKTHLSTEWDCSFPENLTDFVFQKFPEEIQSKIVYFYNLVLFSSLPFTRYSFFFLLSSQLYRQTRTKTLATQANERHDELPSDPLCLFSFSIQGLCCEKCLVTT